MRIFQGLSGSLVVLSLCMVGEARAQTQVGIGFNGPKGTDTAWSPLDPNAAVGPNHVMVLCNGIYRIYTKCGVQVGAADMDILFAALNPTAATIDPNITYDDIAQRFVIEANGSGADITHAYIAVSNTPDPTQGFTEAQVLTFPGALDGSKMGFNADAYVICGNTGMAVIDKSTMLDANNATFTITSQTATTYGRAARMHGAAPGDPVYFTRAGTGGKIRVTRMDNVLSVAPTLTSFDVVGSSGCTDPCTPEWRNNSIATANTQATYWWQLNTSTPTPTLTQQGFIPAPAGFKHAYGSAGIAPNGDMGISYMEYSVDTTPQPVSTWIAWRAAADPLTTTRAPVLAKSSGSLLQATTGHGDFSSTVCDVAQNGTTLNSFWSCNGYIRPNGAGLTKAVWLQNFGALSLSGSDCNGDNIADSCNIVASTSADGNLNGVPDECEGLPASFCAGDGSGNLCPCGNSGGAGRGCANSANATGAVIAGLGLASVIFDSILLSGSGMPASGPCLYFQGTTSVAATLGDGLLCVGGTTIRLSVKFNDVSGSSTIPGGLDPALSVMGGLPAAGGLRTYQCWYRDGSATFCTAATSNMTNGVRFVWQP